MSGSSSGYGHPRPPMEASSSMFVDHAMASSQAIGITGITAAWQQDSIMSSVPSSSSSSAAFIHDHFPAPPSLPHQLHQYSSSSISTPASVMSTPSYLSPALSAIQLLSQHETPMSVSNTPVLPESQLISALQSSSSSSHLMSDAFSSSSAAPSSSLASSRPQAMASSSAYPSSSKEKERATSPSSMSAQASSSLLDSSPSSSQQPLSSGTSSVNSNPSAFRTPSERPVVKLSVSLLKTYKHINEMYYAAKRKKSSSVNPRGGSDRVVYNEGFDDEEGNYVVQVGEELDSRYIVQEVLGKGSFGVVVRAHDTQRNEGVAVKVIRNRPQFYQQAQLEVQILRHLNNLDREDRYNIVRLRRQFTWRSHLCLVFELLSHNLYELLKRSRFNGVSLNLIRKFASQILYGLAFLALPDVGIIHCDLKPENILLRNPKKSSIKLVDFGSSCYLHNKMYKYIQSRFYRSPEVLLGLSYTNAIDMWSLACILVEMHTGVPLFDGRDEHDQVCKVAEVLGMPPTPMITASPKLRKIFSTSTGEILLRKPQNGSGTFTPRRLRDILGVETGGPRGRRKDEQGHSMTDYVRFLDLVQRMLDYNPETRLKPVDALSHAFFRPSSEVATMTPLSLDPLPSVSADIATSSSQAIDRDGDDQDGMDSSARSSRQSSPP